MRIPRGAGEDILRKDFLGQGWGFPFGFDRADGGVSLSAHEENIRQSISLILGTRPGERQMLPEFGCNIHELMFSPNTRATATRVSHLVMEALARWEPRIEVTKVEAWPDGAGTIRLMVQYTVRSTMTRQELSVAFTGG